MSRGSLRAVLIRLLLLPAAATLLSCSPARQAATLHPAFAITGKDLQGLAAGLPEESRLAIGRQPAVYLDLAAQALSSPQELLLLVDKSHGLSPENGPADLVPLERYPLALSRPGLALRREVIPDLLAMVESARAQGIELAISSTYRSYEQQERIYEANVRQMGREQADRESARPGRSQHQLGTTIDFGSIDASFASTPAGRWLADSAWRFGWSLSYPRDGEEETGYLYEPWHYRYVGRPAARLIREFFMDRQQLFLEYWSRAASLYREKLLR